jgi:coenzyme F420-reducing hydrogenase delta subunit
MSAGEGTKFAAAADEMTERVRKLGPSPLHPKERETSSVKREA